MCLLSTVYTLSEMHATSWLLWHSDLIKFNCGQVWEAYHDAFPETLVVIERYLERSSKVIEF